MYVQSVLTENQTFVTGETGSLRKLVRCREKISGPTQPQSKAVIGTFSSRCPLCGLARVFYEDIPVSLVLE